MFLNIKILELLLFSNINQFMINYAIFVQLYIATNIPTYKNAKIRRKIL